MSTLSFNADSGAVSRYEGFEFSGFLRVGSSMFGITGSGLHELGGDTDDGVPIVSRIDTDTLSPAGEMLTRIDRMTLGFDGPGTIVAHAVHGSGGVGTQMNYQQPEMTAEFPRPGVTKIGRGPASRFWRFHIIASGPVSLFAASIKLMPTTRTR